MYRNSSCASELFFRLLAPRMANSSAPTEANSSRNSSSKMMSSCSNAERHVTEAHALRVSKGVAVLTKLQVNGAPDGLGVHHRARCQYETARANESAPSQVDREVSRGIRSHASRRRPLVE